MYVLVFFVSWFNVINIWNTNKVVTKFENHLYLDRLSQRGFNKWLTNCICSIWSLPREDQPTIWQNCYAVLKCQLKNMYFFFSTRTTLLRLLKIGHDAKIPKNKSILPLQTFQRNTILNNLLQWLNIIYLLNFN